MTDRLGVGVDAGRWSSLLATGPRDNLAVWAMPGHQGRDRPACLEAMRASLGRLQGDPVGDVPAVLSVPVSAAEGDRRRLRQEALEAGFQPLRLLNEPTAVALAYHTLRGTRGRHAVLVWGAGHLDLSVIELRDEAVEVLAAASSTALGGDSLDAHLAAAWSDQEHPEERLVAVARRARTELGDRLAVELPPVEGCALPAWMTRGWMSAILAAPQGGVATRGGGELLPGLRALAGTALGDAQLRPRELDGMLLAGGCARTPLLRRAAAHLLEQTPLMAIDPQEAVAKGAALHAAHLVSGAPPLLVSETTPVALNVAPAGGVTAPVLPRNARVPASCCRAFRTLQDQQEILTLRVSAGAAPEQLEVIGLSPEPAGARIDVAFVFDADGVLHVAARDARRRWLDVRREGPPAHPLDLSSLVAWR